jgi:hypothetical protein
VFVAIIFQFFIYFFQLGTQSTLIKEKANKLLQKSEIQSVTKIFISFLKKPVNGGHKRLCGIDLQVKMQQY